MRGGREPGNLKKKEKSSQEKKKKKLIRKKKEDNRDLFVLIPNKNYGDDQKEN